MLLDPSGQQCKVIQESSNVTLSRRLTFYSVKQLDDLEDLKQNNRVNKTILQCKVIQDSNVMLFKRTM